MRSASDKSKIISGLACLIIVYGRERDEEARFFCITMSSRVALYLDSWGTSPIIVISLGQFWAGGSMLPTCTYMYD